MNKEKKELPKWYKPSKKDAEWFIANWKDEGKFSAPVKVMFNLCKTYPKNDNLEEVLLKCATINAFSSTNVLDLYSMAKHIVDMHIDEKLNSNNYSIIKDLSEVIIGGKSRKFYSFATKYCHYHNPEFFPIYDSYVAKVLCSFPEFKIIKIKELREYQTFVDTLNEFRHYYGLNLTYINLDKYLWRLGRWYLNPYETTPKYYHREDINPFPEDDTRNKLWQDEMELITTHRH